MATRKKAAKKSVGKKGRKSVQGAPATPNTEPRRGADRTAPVAAGPGNIRIRMYRIGFGDFFLMTVPERVVPPTS